MFFPEIQKHHKIVISEKYCFIEIWLQVAMKGKSNKIQIKFFKLSASVCDYPPIPEGASFKLISSTVQPIDNLTTTDRPIDNLTTTIRQTIQVRFTCNVGLYLLSNDVITCDVSVSGEDPISNGFRIGEVPVCISDVASHKPASQSSLTGLANKPVDPKNVQVTKHQGQQKQI